MNALDPINTYLGTTMTYGAARTLAYSRGMRVRTHNGKRTRPILTTEKVISMAFGAVLNVLVMPFAPFQDAINLEKHVRGITDDREIPLPLAIAFPHNSFYPSICILKDETHV